MSDRSLDLLTEAILERDQPRTADLFYGMVARDGRSLRDALSVVTTAEAPFVQVPSHINVRDGAITLINNDHTILGLRTSVSLAPFLPERYRMLSFLQSVWYIPAGLDIWNQLLGKYPGRYATMKGMNVPPPSYGPVVWHQEQAPIVEEGTVEERLHAHMIATMSGDVRRSYGLFLGLVDDPEARPRLRDHLIFLGLIDVQDTVIGRKARNTGHKALRARAVTDLADFFRSEARPRLRDHLIFLGLIDVQDTVIGRKARNTGHKALRARAVTDLADFIGWENAHGVYYIGVPDMAVGPLYYSAYDAACVVVTADLPDAGKNLAQTNQTPLTPAEVEETIERLMTADAESVWALLTTHLKNGKSLRSLGDTI